MEVVENKELNLLAESFFAVEQTVRKVWGTEYWVVNTPDYCMKLMVLNPHFECSKHRHIIKNETFVVMSGEMVLWLRNEGEESWESIKLAAGQKFTLEAGTWHQFSNYSRKPTLFMEVSTHHDDMDVERLCESGPC